MSLAVMRGPCLGDVQNKPGLGRAPSPAGPIVAMSGACSLGPPGTRATPPTRQPSQEWLPAPPSSPSYTNSLLEASPLCRSPIETSFGEKRHSHLPPAPGPRGGDPSSAASPHQKQGPVTLTITNTQLARPLTRLTSAPLFPTQSLSSVIISISPSRTTAFPTVGLGARAGKTGLTSTGGVRISKSSSESDSEARVGD